MLTKYLKDFSVPDIPPPAEPTIVDSLAHEAEGAFDFGFDDTPPVDIDEERRQAHAEGYTEAAEKLERHYQAEIEELKRAHADELTLLRRQHEQEIVAQIHTRFHEMMREILEIVSAQTLDVLLPVFTAELSDLAVATLGRQISDMFKDNGTALVTVKGPTTLYAKLKPLLDADGIVAKFVEASTPDISVEINETVLVTRLETWAQALLEVSTG